MFGNDIVHLICLFLKILFDVDFWNRLLSLFCLLYTLNLCTFIYLSIMDL